MSSNRRVADPFDETGYRGRRGGGLLKGAAGFLLVLATASAASFFFGDTIREGGDAVRAWAEAEPEEVAPAPVAAAPLPPREPSFYEKHAFSVYFDALSTDLTPSYQAETSARMLSAWEECDGRLAARIEAHDDYARYREASFEIAAAYAQSLRAFLTSELWLADDDIVTISYGRERPRHMDGEAEDWVLNRRAEVELSCIKDPPPRPSRTVDDFDIEIFFADSYASPLSDARARLTDRMARAGAACPVGLGVALDLLQTEAASQATYYRAPLDEKRSDSLGSVFRSLNPDASVVGLASWTVVEETTLGAPAPVAGLDWSAKASVRFICDPFTGSEVLDQPG